MEHYKAGELNEPIAIYRPVDVTDGAGGYTTTYTRDPVSGSSWHHAKVRPLRGTEVVIADRIANPVALLFVVHAALGVRAKDEIEYQGIRYNVRLVRPATAQSVFQEVEAEAGVPLVD